MADTKQSIKDTLLRRLFGVDGPPPAGTPGTVADSPEQVKPTGTVTSVDTGSPLRKELIAGFSGGQVLTGVAALIGIAAAFALLARR